MKINKKRILKIVTTTIGLSFLASLITLPWLKSAFQLVEPVKFINTKSTSTRMSSSVDTSSEILDASLYTTKIDNTSSDMVVLPINTSSVFSLSDGSSNNFWQLSFQKLIGSPFGYKLFVSNVANEYKFTSPSFSKDKLTLDNIDDPTNVVNYTLYDSNLLETNGSQLNSSVWDPSEFVMSQNNNLYGFRNGPEESVNILNNNMSLNNRYPIMLVSSKIPYTNDNKPLPYIDSNQVNFDSQNGVYDLVGNNLWFSSGYFVYNNSLAYYVPQTELKNTDFIFVDNTPSELKNTTASNFLEYIKQATGESYFSITIKNTIPGLEKGQLHATVNDAEGRITFSFKPDKLISLATIDNAIIQLGIVNNTDTTFEIGSIDGFYKNTNIQTSIVNNGNKVTKSVGAIGKRFSPKEISNENIIGRITELKDQIWTQIPDDPQIEIIGEPNRTADDVTVIARPKIIIQDGKEIVSQLGSRLDVTVTLNEFEKFPVTDLVPLENPIENLYLPSELEYYFSSNYKPEISLTEKLKNYAEFTGNESDVRDIVVTNVNVIDPNDQNGTVSLTVDANNCRFEDQSKRPNTFSIQLKNLRTIKDTEIIDEIDYSDYNEAQPFTVEKFIYTLSKNKTISDQFETFIANNVVLNKPIDATISITKIDDALSWYSNKNKTLTLKISLDKYYSNGNKENNLKEVNVTFNITTATSPLSSTSLNGNATYDFSNKYASEVSDDEIKDYLWQKLIPNQQDNDLSNIIAYPQNLDGSSLTTQNILLTRTNDIENGTITIEYQLNRYYDEVNFNTINTSSFDETVKEEVLNTKKPDLTKWDDTIKEINIVGFEDIKANNFNEQNNQTIIDTIWNHLNITGNVNGVSVSYTIKNPQINDDIYNGKLVIIVTINNAVIFDKNNSNNGYSKIENVNLGEFTLIGFEKFGATSLKNPDINNNDEKTVSIKSLIPDNDTTANNIDWSKEKLIDLIFDNIDNFFINLPRDFDKSNIIIISEPSYTGLTSTPTIRFKISLNNFLTINGNNVSNSKVEKPFGTIILTDFRKSVESNFIPNFAIGNPEIIPQLINNTNLLNNLNLANIIQNPENMPENYNISDNIEINLIENANWNNRSWNNKDGKIYANITIKGIYIDDGTGQFPLGDKPFANQEISNFKSVKPTIIKTNLATNNDKEYKIELQDFANYYASNITITEFKDILFNNINSIIDNLPNNNTENDFTKDNLIFTEGNLTRTNNYNDSNSGAIIVNSFLIDNFYTNDKTNTWSYPRGPYGGQISLGKLIVTGFDQIQPTDLTDDIKNNGLVINNLNSYIAQDIDQQQVQVLNLIKTYIAENKQTIFNSLPTTINDDEIIVNYKPNTWNNKSRSIVVEVILPSYYDNDGILQNSNSNPFEISIIGFREVTPTKFLNSIVNNNYELHLDNLTQIATKVTDNELKEIIANNINLIIPENSYVNTVTSDMINFKSKNAINNSAGSDFGKIKITNLTINQYFANDDKYTFNKNMPLSLGNLTIIGFKKIEETRLNETIITVTGLSNYVAQQSTNLFDTTFKKLIIDHIINEQDYIFNVLPEKLTDQDLFISYVSDSWNNKNQSILININLKKYYDSNGIESDGSTSKPFNNIVINGFKFVEPTNIISIIETGIKDKYPTELSNDEIKQYIVNNQDAVFQNIPTNFLSGGKYTLNDIEVVKQEDTINLVNGTVDVQVTIKKAYINDEKYSYSDQTNVQLTTTIKVDKVSTPTIDPIFETITIDPNIQINGVAIGDVLVQNFHNEYTNNPINVNDVIQNIKQQLVDQFNNTNSNSQITLNDLSFTFDNSSINNTQGSININSITISNGKYIDHNGQSVPEQLLPVNITIDGFKQIRVTSLTKTLFDADNMTGFDATQFTNTNPYPQLIVENQLNELITAFSNWLKNNLTSWITDIHVDDNQITTTNWFNLTYSTYSNKERHIQFNLTIDKEYVYANPNGLYGVEDLNQSVNLYIGKEISGVSSVNASITISSDLISGVLPSDFKDNYIEINQEIKQILVTKLEEERQTNFSEFLNNNLMFTNLPETWKELDLTSLFNIEYISSNDDNGSITFRVVITNAPFFVEDGNDYKYVESYSSTVNNDDINTTIFGFKKNNPFPLIPVILSSIAVAILIIIAIILCYYYYKKKKYKTITIANENEL